MVTVTNICLKMCIIFFLFNKKYIHSFCVQNQTMKLMMLGIANNYVCVSNNLFGIANDYVCVSNNLLEDYNCVKYTCTMQL